MSTSNRAMVDGMGSQLENLWGVLDELWDSMSTDDWKLPHGPDWSMVDAPFHMSYFDRELVVNTIEKGPDVPESEQVVMRTINELNAWNEKMFQGKPANLEPQQALDMMLQSRNLVKDLLKSTTDSDMGRPVFIPITGMGWLNTGMILGAYVSHTWNHAMELRLRLDRSGPVPDEGPMHTALSFYNNFPLMLYDPEAGAGKNFNTVMEYTGPGGGAWTISVTDGQPSVAEGRVDDPDLVMVQSPDTFVKVLTGITDPMEAIQNGEIQVEGMENMMTYGTLFPQLTPDRDITPMGSPTPLG